MGRESHKKWIPRTRIWDTLFGTSVKSLKATSGQKLHLTVRIQFGIVVDGGLNIDGCPKR
jgi:hypothetical protein